MKLKSKLFRCLMIHFLLFSFLFSICSLFFISDSYAESKIRVRGETFRGKRIRRDKDKKKKAEKEKAVLTSPDNIKISEKNGDIKETWDTDLIAGEDKKIIIHVQDAHCNYEAQTNIYKIIDGLMKEYPDQLKLVAVEGSVGIIDTSPFAEFSDKEIKEEVADYFMKKGKITGPEYLSITGDHDFTIYGIETKELYDRNYKAFLDSLPFRDESEQYCEHLQEVLNKLKKPIYNDDLRKYDKQLTDYQNEEIGFVDYVNVLGEWSVKKNVDTSKYVNYDLLQKAQEIEENVDFDVVEKERNQLIDNLGGVLGKEKLQELVQKSLNFRLGKITAGEYYDYLEVTVDGVSDKVSKGDYPNLFAYMDYVDIHYKMDKNKLFDECALLENDIAQSMFENDNQKKLFTYSKHVGILQRMFKLGLVKDDYKYYQKNKGDFKTATFLSFIKVQAPRYNIEFQEDPGLSKIDENLPIIEEFYDVALLRDPVLIDNMLKEMEREDVNMCFMIAGGFHSRGLMEILEERQISYAVISPKITKEQEYNPYIDIMTNKKTPFEEFLEQLGEE